MESRILGDSLVITMDQSFQGQAMGDFLGQHLRFPDNFISELWRDNRVTIGSQSALGSHILRAGEKIRFAGGIIEDAGAGLWNHVLDYPLSVLYEDQHALIVNKPRGLLVHPGSSIDTDTLAHRVAAHYRAQGIERKVRHAHRLDKDTTGAILYAKHAYSARTFDSMIANHEIARLYVAIVEGIPDPPVGVIDAAIGRDRHVSGKYRVSRTGKSARTHYKTIATTKASNVAFAVVACRLDTGRTHQIRVHLSHIGTPIVGDHLYRKVYGAKGLFRWGEGYALHAAALSFWHPYENVRVETMAPFGAQFLKGVEALSFRASWYDDFLLNGLDSM